jgi:hypothetical protein
MRVPVAPLAVLQYESIPIDLLDLLQAPSDSGGELGRGGFVLGEEEIGLDELELHQQEAAGRDHAVDPGVDRSGPAVDRG